MLLQSHVSNLDGSHACHLIFTGTLHMIALEEKAKQKVGS